jgi:hypothetical protein
MKRGGEHRLRGRHLHHASGIHDPHPVGDLGEETQIVRDVEHRHAEAGFERDEQGHDLFLRGDVEPGGRLIQHHEIRIAGERHGDADSLLLAARELVRVAPHEARLRRQAHQREELCRGHRCGVLMGLAHLVDLAADAHAGIERGRGILRDEADPVAAQAIELVTGKREEVAAAVEAAALPIGDREGAHVDDR